MFKKIIVGYDDTDQSRDALVLSKQLAGASGAELIVSHVVRVHPLMRGGIDPIPVEEETELADRLNAVASEHGGTAQIVESSSVPRGLHTQAEEAGADLVVVGSSRHGKVGHALLGNVAASLMHGSPCAVAVAPSGYRDSAADSISTIVVGYDGSPESKFALDRACELAGATGAQLRLVSAAEPPPVVFGKAGGTSGGWSALREEIDEDVRSKLEAGKASIPDDIKAETKLVEDEPVPALVKEASSPGSVLVLGSREYGPVRGVMLGSVSRAVAARAAAPLIVYPRSSRRDDAATPAAEAGATV